MFDRRRFLGTTAFGGAGLAVGATGHPPDGWYPPAEHERAPEGQTSPTPSSFFGHNDLPARESGAVRIRDMLDGTTRLGLHVDFHSTELAPGERPHAPHRHVHEEILFIRDGELEVTVGESTSNLGPGSAVYVASGDEHGWRNVGWTPATYFVLSLGTDDD